MELIHNAHSWVLSLSLGFFLVFLIAVASVYGFKRFRSIGWGMVVIGCCFLHAMATKPINISKKSVTATNLVFDVAVTNALVGEFGQFYYKTVTGNTLVDADQAPVRAGSSFLIPSTNFTHTIPGCYIWGGIDRNFYLQVESTNSNSQVISGGTN